MTAGAPSQILVRAGTAEPPSMALPPGQAIGPLSVGRTADWRVIAPGVLEEHAFLYFNGTELFLQSANATAPVTVNGAPIPGDWTAVYAPCEIAFGGARLWFGPEGSARSVAPPPPSIPAPLASAPMGPHSPAPASMGPHSVRPQQAAEPSRGFQPRVTGLDQDDESTRLQPIEEIQHSQRRPQPAAGSPVATLQSATAPPSSIFAGNAPMGPGPLFGPPLPFPPGMAPPSQAPDAPPQAAEPPAKESWIGARWREASTPKKALVILMLPLIWAVYVIFTDKPPAARTQKPAASATSAPSTTPSAGAASASASAAPIAPPPTPPPAPPPATSGKPAAGPASTASAAKTPAREAADAVAVGAYDKAARLYEELAKAHPEVPAYAEAARIMKAKAGKR